MFLVITDTRRTIRCTYAFPSSRNLLFFFFFTSQIFSGRLILPFESFSQEVEWWHFQYSSDHHLLLRIDRIQMAEIQNLMLELPFFNLAS